MKFLTKIIFILILIITPLYSNITYAADSEQSNLKTGQDTSENSSVKNNTALQNLKNTDKDYIIATGGQQGIYNSIIRIARDLKNLFFLISGIYFLIIVLRLLFSEKTEEEVGNFKKGIVWISIGIIITQIAFYLMVVLFDKNVDITLAQDFIKVIIQPLIKLLETATSFFFLFVMIFAFFRIVSSNGDEEKAKSGKMSVLYAIVGFIVVKLSHRLVTAIYGETSCASYMGVNCSNDTAVSGFAEIIVNIINWMNGFIGLVTIILIIYAGFMVLISVGDEEKLKKAKSIILYIAIGLLILVANYLILTFIMSNVK